MNREAFFLVFAFSLIFSEAGLTAKQGGPTPVKASDKVEVSDSSKERFLYIKNHKGTRLATLTVPPGYVAICNENEKIIKNNIHCQFQDEFQDKDIYIYVTKDDYKERKERRKLHLSFFYTPAKKKQASRSPREVIEGEIERKIFYREQDGKSDIKHGRAYFFEIQKDLKIQSLIGYKELSAYKGQNSVVYIANTKLFGDYCFFDFGIAFQGIVSPGKIQTREGVSEQAKPFESIIQSLRVDVPCWDKKYL